MEVLSAQDKKDAATTLNIQFANKRTVMTTYVTFPPPLPESIPNPAMCFPSSLQRFQAPSAGTRDWDSGGEPLDITHAHRSRMAFSVSSVRRHVSKWTKLDSGLELELDLDPAGAWLDHPHSPSPRFCWWLASPLARGSGEAYDVKAGLGWKLGRCHLQWARPPTNLTAVGLRLRLRQYG